MLPGEQHSQCSVFAQGLFWLPTSPGDDLRSTGAAAIAGVTRAIKETALGDGINYSSTAAATSTAAPPLRHRDPVAGCRSPTAESIAAAAAGESNANTQPVCVVVTNYRVTLTANDGRRLDVPLASLGQLQRGRGGGLYWVDLVTRGPFSLRIAADLETRVAHFTRAVEVRLPRRAKDLFAAPHFRALQRMQHGRAREHEAAGGAPAPQALLEVVSADAGSTVAPPLAPPVEQDTGGSVFSSSSDSGSSDDDEVDFAVPEGRGSIQLGGDPTPVGPRPRERKTEKRHGPRDVAVFVDAGWMVYDAAAELERMATVPGWSLDDAFHAAAAPEAAPDGRGRRRSENGAALSVARYPRLRDPALRPLLDPELRRLPAGMTPRLLHPTLAPPTCAGATFGSGIVGVGANLCPWFHVVELPETAGRAFATYPTEVIVPKRADLRLLLNAARFRQNGRVPMVSWINPYSGGVLARASQPLVGRMRRDRADEMLCAYLNQTYSPHAAGHQPSPAAGPTADAAAPEAELPPAAARDRAASEPPVCIIRGESAVLPPRSGDAAAPLFDDPDVPDRGPEEGWAVVDTPPPLDPHRRSSGVPERSATASSARTLHVVDCRSRTAVGGNLATGGGHEMTSHYTRAESHFLGLGNIHAVAKAMDKTRRLCADVQRVCDRWQDGKHTSHGNFLARLDATGWPVMTLKLLHGAVLVSDLLVAGDAVLVHCTDGWDRTSQLNALAMLMLDPHYRTVRGFCILVEQEFLRAGHRFLDRCGLAGAGRAGSSTTTAPEAADAEGTDSDPEAQEAEDDGAGQGPAGRRIHVEESPVFLQFLDGVYQLLRAYPADFEFTPHLLTVLGDAAYSARFGTFLANCHRERLGGRPGSSCFSTASVWSEVARLVAVECALAAGRRGVRPVPPQERVLNPYYQGEPSAPGIAAACVVGSTHGPARLSPMAALAEARRLGHAPRRLRPSFHSKHYRFWRPWFLRYDLESVGDVVGGTGLEAEVTPYTSTALTATHGIMAELRALRQQLAERDGAVAAVEDDTEDTAALRDCVPPSRALTAQLFPAAADTTGFLAAALSVQRSADALSVLQDTGAALVVRVAAPSGGHDGATAEERRAHSRSPARHDLAPGNGGVPTADGDADFSLPREDAAACYLCDQAFTFFDRRHTCRACCRSVCGACGGRFLRLQRSQIALKDEKNAAKPVRVCNTCYVSLRTGPPPPTFLQ